MRSKKRIAWVMTGMVLLFLTNCSTNQNAEVYYLISANVQLPYWQTVANGFSKAAASYKVQSRIAGPQSYDPVAELDALQQAVQTKPAGIMISVSDVSVLGRGIDSAVRQGIPVVAVDSDASATRRLYFIGTNNVEAGRLGGQRLVEKLGNKGNVAFFTIPGQPNL